jgi:rhamnulokinase
MGVEIDTAITNEITLDERLTNEGGFDRSIRLLRNITGLWIIQEVRRDLKSQGIDISYVELVELARKRVNRGAPCSMLMRLSLSMLEI